LGTTGVGSDVWSAVESDVGLAVGLNVDVGLGNIVGNRLGLAVFAFVGPRVGTKVGKRVELLLIGIVLLTLLLPAISFGTATPTPVPMLVISKPVPTRVDTFEDKPKKDEAVFPKPDVAWPTSWFIFTMVSLCPFWTPIISSLR